MLRLITGFFGGDLSVAPSTIRIPGCLIQRRGTGRSFVKRLPENYPSVPSVSSAFTTRPFSEQDPARRSQAIRPRRVRGRLRRQPRTHPPSSRHCCLWQLIVCTKIRRVRCGPGHAFFNSWARSIPVHPQRPQYNPESSFFSCHKSRDHLVSSLLTFMMIFPRLFWPTPPLTPQNLSPHPFVSSI